MCQCLQVTEAELLEAIRTGRASSLKDLICMTQAGDGCTYCHPLLKEYLEKERSRGRVQGGSGEGPRPPARRSAGPSDSALCGLAAGLAV